MERTQEIERADDNQSSATLVDATHDIEGGILSADADDNQRHATLVAATHDIEAGILPADADDKRSHTTHDIEAGNLHLRVGDLVENGIPRNVLSSPCGDLFKANWKLSRKYYQENPDSWKMVESCVALLYTSMRGFWPYVEKILEIMPSSEWKALEFQEENGCTILHVAAELGTGTVVKLLVKMNKNLLTIRDNQGRTPLDCAAYSANIATTRYLAKVSDIPDPCSHGNLMVDLINAGFCDVANRLCHRFSGLALARCKIDGFEWTTLHALATKPSAFQSCSKHGFWGNCVFLLAPAPAINYDCDNKKTTLELKAYLAQGLQYLCLPFWIVLERLAPSIQQYRDEKLNQEHTIELLKCIAKETSSSAGLRTRLFGDLNIIHTAACFGIVEIVELCLEKIPALIWEKQGGQIILHFAVEHRHEKIINLIREKFLENKRLAYSLLLRTEEIMLLAAKQPSASKLKSVAGPSLQMQRELQWFQEVKKICYMVSDRYVNDKQEKAWELFMDEHKDLLKNGETWMKDTSNSCMVVTTLIATIAFAAAITVPGGNSSNGTPVFLNDTVFAVFAISDALSLFSSTTSLLMFLSILTSRFAEQDFLIKLPTKLILGQAFLFLSVAAMMVSFISTLWLVLSNGLKWVVLPSILLGCVPVTLFIIMQLPLFLQMVYSTYVGPFHRHRKLRFYSRAWRKLVTGFSKCQAKPTKTS